MATAYIPLNNGTHPCVTINGVAQHTPVNGEIAAADILYVIPWQTKVNGTFVNTVRLYVGQDSTTPVSYDFVFSSLSAFSTWLTTQTITNTLFTYTKLKVVNGTINHAANTALTNALVNESLVGERTYNSVTNVTSVSFTSLTRPTFGNIVLGFVGNQTSGSAFATATLAVPIAASPVAGDSITMSLNGSTIGYILVSTQTQADLESQILAAYAILGYTYTPSLTSNVYTLSGTAPAKGSSYNGTTISFVPFGTTFGSSAVTATYSGGI